MLPLGSPFASSCNFFPGHRKPSKVGKVEYCEGIVQDGGWAIEARIKLYL
jgi:hypothetical protein